MQTLQQKPPRNFSDLLTRSSQRYGNEHLKYSRAYWNVGEDCCALVRIAHFDLIERVIECLPTVHLAIQTA